MITVIKNIRVYSPQDLGIRDVVVVGNKVEGIYESINVPGDFININIIEGTGKLLFPGFIDSHVHIMGGGGEGGFKTRTPELQISKFIKCGITTVVGCRGTDGICRDMNALIAKANALDEEGITTYCYTGSYDVPVRTITGEVKSDIMLLDKIIGVGEIAISDNRSSEPTYEEFKRVIADARVGGLLSGKSGIVNIHLGSGKKGLEYLFKIIEDTEIPSTQMLPTHINRSDILFNKGLEYIKAGGYIDLTTSSDPKHLEPGELRASEGLKIAYENKIPIEHITFSSDGNGSMPIFNEKNELVGLGICSVASLYDELKEAILKNNVPIEEALKVVTSNVADILKIDHKGRIEPGKDADLVIVDENELNIIDVIAKGRLLMKDGNVLVKGTFES